MIGLLFVVAPLALGPVTRGVTLARQQETLLTAFLDHEPKSKSPHRSASAVRKATIIGLAGYQGPSTTKSKPRGSSTSPKPRSTLGRKTPKRSAGAVTKATTQSLAGYQGPSTTKERTARDEQKKPRVVSQKLWEPILVVNIMGQPTYWDQWYSVPL